MKIWVDADACPRDAREMVYRTANRLKVETILVANSSMRFPKSAFISMQIVEKGFDVADDQIAENVAPGDLVITADIPLAARIVDKGAAGIDPRGQIFDEENVKERLATRNLLMELRDAGMVGGGPKPYKPADKSRFASALDRLVTRMLRELPD